MDQKILLANTKGQELKNHSKLVGNFTYIIINKLINNEEIAKMGYIAGILHDIGKVDSIFQNWVRGLEKKKRIWNTYPRHNEISLLLMYILISIKDPYVFNIVKHAVYYHHPKPLREKDLTNIKSIYESIKDNYSNYEIDYILKNILSELSKFSKNIEIKDINTNNIKDYIEDINVPIYKQYNDEYEDFSNDFYNDIKKKCY